VRDDGISAEKRIMDYGVRSKFIKSRKGSFFPLRPGKRLMFTDRCRLAMTNDRSSSTTFASSMVADRGPRTSPSNEIHLNKQ
jgi:hypothetical protein